ncbi:hypothetical protein F5I97DRAFT_1807930 [Phlebopus sp. FC_14]|nr:hypothetical protein F5I97DRAFT_1807930 [Phlebopus sp. FC_14]
MAPMKSERMRKPYARPRASDGLWTHDRAPFSAKGNSTAHPASTTVPNTKLVVSNLHYEITPKDLVSIFGQVGTLVREPLIRYDRSGRSSGVAIVSFETPLEASRAKKQYEGKLAKGQPMEIAFDTAPPRRVRSASMPGVSTSSLLNRIERPSLVERLESGKDTVPQAESAGPIRTRGAPRPSRRGGPPRSRAERPVRPKVKTAEELDREIDVFMGEDEGVNTRKDATGPAVATQDVEMA